MFLHKSYIWEKSCSWDVSQNALSQSNCMILNELFLRSKLRKSGLWTLKFTVSQELTDFLHAGANSCKLKGRWKFRGWCSQNRCGQSCDGTLKLTLSEERTNGINWFLVCSCRFITVKSWSKIYWVDMVKNGCGQSGHGTLIFNLTLTWFFAC